MRWAQSALAQQDACFELTIRVVEENESMQLNRSYRDRNKATNVLSFPSVLPDEIQIELQTSSGCRVLGDLVICAPVVNHEAGLQGKPPGDHWAHLVIHGILHLLGAARCPQQCPIKQRQVGLCIGQCQRLHFAPVNSLGDKVVGAQDVIEVCASGVQELFKFRGLRPSP